jgi:hypothetical protein
MLRDLAGLRCHGMSWTLSISITLLLTNNKQLPGCTSLGIRLGEALMVSDSDTPKTIGIVALPLATVLSGKWFSIVPGAPQGTTTVPMPDHL